MLKNFMPIEDRWIRFGQDDEQWNGNKPYAIWDDYNGIGVLDDDGKRLPLNHYSFKYGDINTYFKNGKEEILVGTLGLNHGYEIWYCNTFLPEFFEIRKIFSTGMSWVYKSDGLVYEGNSIKNISHSPSQDDIELINNILNTDFSNYHAADLLINHLKEMGELYRDVNIHG